MTDLPVARHPRRGYTLNAVLSLITLFGIAIFIVLLTVPGGIETSAIASVEPSPPEATPASTPATTPIPSPTPCTCPDSIEVSVEGPDTIEGGSIFALGAFCSADIDCMTSTKYVWSWAGGSYSDWDKNGIIGTAPTTNLPLELDITVEITVRCRDRSSVSGNATHRLSITLPVPKPTPPPTPTPVPTPTPPPGECVWNPVDSPECIKIEVVGDVTRDPPEDLQPVNIFLIIICKYPIECTFRQLFQCIDSEGSIKDEKFKTWGEEKITTRMLQQLPDSPTHTIKDYCGEAELSCWQDCDQYGRQPFIFY